MNRNMLLLLILFCISGCATVNVNSKGALVQIYKPSTIKESLVCSVGKDEGISFMYVGSDTISGNVEDEDKFLIAQYARSVLGETRFINPVTMPSMGGEYPDLSINVIRYKVETRKKGVSIEKYGVLQANFSVRQGGILECSTGEPILVEKRIVQPAYKVDQMPSDLKVKEMLVKDAVSKVIRQFVPVTSTILRPVKGIFGVAKSAADMINSGNCIGAYELLRPIVDSEDCKDIDAIYNAGVALECMAWNNANDLNSQHKYLAKSLEYYRRAALLDAQDHELQKAMGDVSYELNTIFSSTKKQKETKMLLDEFRTPTGY